MNIVDIENAVEIVTMLKTLTEGEGDTVTIINDNPDFGGHNSCVETTKFFGHRVSHHGGSVLECLRDAVKFHAG